MTNPTFILPSSPGIAANNLYALKVGNQPERFSPISGTFARSTTASRLNANGLIESIGINTPRLDYSYGSCPAVLLEPQRTNLFKHSEDFTTINWSPGNSTITSNTTTAPDGTTTADTLSDTITASNNSYTINQGQSWTSGTAYTMSVYAKNIDRRYIYLRFVSTAFTSNLYAYFDLQTGVIVSTTAGVTAKIESAANGFYRCIATATATATATANGIIGLSDSGTSNVYTNPAVKSVYIWGAQLEAGAFPTTYIPTTSAAVTRTADSFSYSNIYTNGYVSPQGGTWLVELKNNVSYTRDASGNGIYLSKSNTNVNDSILIRTISANSRVSIQKYIAGASTILYTTTTDSVKLAIKWNGTTADVFVNGVKQVSSTVFIETNLDYLLTQILDTPKFIQSMALFSTPLSDSDCALLTSDTYGTFATLASSTSYTLS